VTGTLLPGQLRLWIRNWPSISDTLLFASFAVIVGTFDAAALFSWHNLNPLHLDWLHGDPAVYQAGWEFLRKGTWSFPLTWVSKLDYPFGISVSYLDVIPLVAVPLRLASAVLPSNVQYLGLYAATCCILQSYFGCKLVSRFSSDKVIILVGALFFLNSPILLNRFYGHFSLSSQWLILASLYYHFRPIDDCSIARYAMPFAILAFVAGGITPYLAVMVLLIGFCALLRFPFANPRENILPRQTGQGRAMGRRGWQDAFDNLAIRQFAWSLSLICSLGISLVIFGFVIFGSGSPYSGSGYTQYAMNVLSPINPAMSALYFKSFEVFPSQAYEGFNYLGMGIIIIGFVCLSRSPALIRQPWKPALRPILLASVLLTILALSTRITLGQRVLFTIPMPQAVLNLLATFRSSGRFFWPVHYLLILGALVGTIATLPTVMARRLVLTVGLLVQYFDTLPLRAAVARQARTTYSDPLVAPDWSTVSRSHSHFVVLPAWQCDQIRTPGGDETWPWLARLAARGGMTLNSVHAARISAASNILNCVILPERLLREGPAKNSAYVLSDPLALSIVGRFANTHYCRRVNDLNLCTYDPILAPRSRELGEQILPPYVRGTEFEAGRPPPKSMLFDGWDLRPSPAIWTVGKDAIVYLRQTQPPTGNLRLEMKFGGQGALLTAAHSRQRALISVDGKPVGEMVFIFGHAINDRSIIIPRRLVDRPGIVEIHFELPDAAKPRDLGINADGRRLGLYVSSLRVVDSG
jgi:hypothetical protein